MVAEQISIGIIGCGRIAHAHTAAVENLSGVKIESIADIDEDNLKLFSNKYDISKKHKDYAVLLRDEEIDAVIICVPHNLHKKITLDALEAGKHVLLEKPMAIDYPQSKEMVEASEKNGRILMVGQSRRFNDAALRLKKEIDKGELGNIFKIVINFLVLFKKPPTKWWVDENKSGDLITHLQGSHTIDSVIWFLEELPRNVYAVSKKINYAVPDEQDIILEYQDIVASIHLSINTSIYTNDIYVIGDKGTALMQEYPLEEDFSFGYRLKKDAKTLIDSEQKPDNYTIQLKEFVDSIRENREPLASGRDVLRTMKTIDAVIQSSQNNDIVKVKGD